MQLVFFYDVYEQLGVFGVGGIACFFKACCPAFIVVAVELEEFFVAFSFQKFRVVMEGSFGVLVAAKTFIGLVVIGIVGFAVPVIGAFEAKVIVGFARQCAVAAARLQYALRQGDAGGYAMLLHFLAGYLFVGGYILFGSELVAGCALLAVQLPVARRKQYEQ